MTIGVEIDFLAVGDGERSGDAIVLRLGDLHAGDQFVMVIDGGTQDSGKRLVEHIKEHYSASRVDLVVMTHPDGDHASGLSVVLEELEVGELWMHLPWDHTNGLADAFKDGRVTDNSIAKHLRDSLETAYKVAKLAKEKNVPIREPFAGVNVTVTGMPENAGASISVLGPSEEYFESLLPLFRGTPEPKEALGKLAKAIAVLKEKLRMVAETLDLETLTDDGETSAENNTSVILSIAAGDRRMLFTGDAGIPALEAAADHAASLGIDLRDVHFIQVPHHGSRRNVGPTILNRIVGSKTKDAPTKTAYVSAAKEGAPKHPAKKVLNAFTRRGAKVFATQGTGLRHHKDAPERKGWTSLEPMPLFSEVEEWD